MVSYNELVEQKKIASAMRALGRKQMVTAFDAFQLNSRPTKAQQTVLDDLGKIKYRYVVAGNRSGKSQLASREIAWILTNTHPKWTRPPEWGNEQLTFLIAGQDLTMLASEIWGNKIAPFLDLSEWQLVKQGNTLKRCVNRKTGDQIIFLSHSDGSESNRKHMQGYTAHYVWLDEMPSNISILEELQGRISTTGGYFIATFTPKFRSDAIRRIVDGASEPYSKKYRLSMLDNPKVDKNEQANRLTGQTQSYINTVLYGEWSTGDNSVYNFNYEQMTVDKLPDHYNTGWRHVVSVDPALRSKCGYNLWAEDPNNGTWYLVRDDYIEGSQTLDPETLYHLVEERHKNHHVIRRISDSMAFFTSVASKHGKSYMIPPSKNDNRKLDLIKGLQTGLSSGKMKIGRWCGTFVDEIQSCQFSDESDKIIAASSYHTLDSAQYFADLIPVYNPLQAFLPWDHMLQVQNKERLKKENMEKQMNKNGTRVVRSMSGWARARGNKINLIIKK